MSDNRINKLRAALDAVDDALGEAFRAGSMEDGHATKPYWDSLSTAILEGLGPVRSKIASVLHEFDPDE